MDMHIKPFEDILDNLEYYDIDLPKIPTEDLLEKMDIEIITIEMWNNANTDTKQMHKSNSWKCWNPWKITKRYVYHKILNIQNSISNNM